MAAAYRALSPTMQSFLGTLRAIHRFKRADSGKDAQAYNEKVNNKALISEHPLVTVHPETGGVLFIYQFRVCSGNRRANQGGK